MLDRTRKTFGHALIVGVAALAAGVGRVQAERLVQVDVEVAQTNYSWAAKHGANQAQTARVASARAHAWAFRCVVGLRLWWIESRFSPTALNTYEGDGTNVYHSTQVVAQGPPEVLEDLRKRFPGLTVQVDAAGGGRTTSA